MTEVNPNTPAPTANQDLSSEVKGFVDTAKEIAKGLVAAGHKIPENYKTPEDYATALLGAQAEYTRAHQELSALKKAQANAAAVTPKEKIELQPTQSDDSMVIKTPPTPAPIDKPAGLDWDKWLETAAENNFTLPPEVREEIKTKVPGFTDKEIDRFLYGAKASENALFTEMAQEVGGKDTLRAITQWAGKELVKSQDEAKELTAALRGPSRKLFIRGLQAEYTRAQEAKQTTRNEPPAINATGQSNTAAAPTGVDPFESRAEMNNYLGSMDYGTDPQFRAWVDARIVHTHNVGFKRRG